MKWGKWCHSSGRNEESLNWKQLFCLWSPNARILEEMGIGGDANMHVWGRKCFEVMQLSVSTFQWTDVSGSWFLMKPQTILQVTWHKTKQLSADFVHSQSLDWLFYAKKKPVTKVYISHNITITISFRSHLDQIFVCMIFISPSLTLKLQLTEDL